MEIKQEIKENSARLLIIHTEVDDSLGGKGVGKQLVADVDNAEKNHP